jgi:hypothetical protein
MDNVQNCDSCIKYSRHKPTGLLCLLLSYSYLFSLLCKLFRTLDISVSNSYGLDDQEFSRFHRVQTGYRIHPDHYSMGIRRSLPGLKRPQR